MQSRILHKRRAADEEDSLANTPPTNMVNSEASVKHSRLSGEAPSTSGSLKEESTSLENRVDTTLAPEHLPGVESEQLKSKPALSHLLADKIYEQPIYKECRFLILNEAGYVQAVGLSSVADLSATFLSYSADKTIPNEKNYTHAYIVFKGNDLKTKQPIQLVLMRPFAGKETLHKGLKQWVSINMIQKYFNERIELDLNDYCFSGECKSLLTIEQVLQMIDQPIGAGIVFNTKGTQTDAFKPIAKLKSSTGSGEIRLADLLQRWDAGEKPSLPRIFTYIPKPNFDLDATWDVGVKFDSPSYRRKSQFFSSNEQIGKDNSQESPYQDKLHDNNESEDLDKDSYRNNSNLD